MNNNSCDTISQPLRRLLKQFELTAMNSLRGPSSEMTNSGLPFGASGSSSTSLSPIRPNAERPITVEKFGRDSLLDVLATMSSMKDAPRFMRPSPMMPVMTPRDHSTERHETLLEGEVVSCFVVGGEKRLCLPQVLNTVLRDYSLQDINAACTELHIHRSQCSKDQLEILKIVGILPVGSVNCGLVTKTDAERLCNFLSHSRRTRRNRLTASSTGAAVVSSSSAPTSTEREQQQRRLSSSTLPVYHECFGRCRGRYRQEKYTSLSAECIECEECNELYAPDRFVLHSHRNHETKTCHWGFDSANWRAYLHLAPEIETVKEGQSQLENMKAKFQSVGGTTTTKRTFDNTSLPQPSAKRPKLEHSLYDYPNVQNVTPVQLTSALPPAPPLPSLVLCDPLLVAYYHALTNSRFNFGSAAYPPSLLPLVSTLTNSGGDGTEKTYANFQPPLSSAVQEAAAALLKLSPQSSKDVGVQMEPKLMHTKYVSESSAPCVEPLKKHILHRSQSQQNVADEILRRQISSTKDSSTGQLEEDSQTIETLLYRYVNDPDGLKTIKAKLEETRRNLDGQLDSLSAQNRILQQEIAYLRNKQTMSSATCGGVSVLTTVSP